MEFETDAIHVGEEPERTKDGDVVSPIHLSTTFAKSTIDKMDDEFVYTRSSNPTRNNLEMKLSSLENSRYALAFSSGSAAQTSLLLALLEKGDHVVAFDDLYGGTKRIFRQVFADFGVESSYVDATDIKNVKKALKDETALVWLESPTNPLLKLSDISKVADLCHEEDIILVVDNTFMSPYFQKPLEMDADVVLHSTTKYLGGHSDSLGGALMTNDEDIYERLAFHQNAVGAVLSPFDSWVVMRGIKTLALRMERHEKNAQGLADWLNEHPKVKNVHYPGLRSHPQHQLAKEQMSGFGGMLSFEIRGTIEDARIFVESLDLFALAESLGGVESLIEIPSFMTHASVPEEDRKGITDTLIRVSVGIENFTDLKKDFEKGFEAVSES